jgi:Non-ribosomal peptide synthetase modules and related proteins
MRGARVGLCLPRDMDMLPALLGTLLSGAAYVPLDPNFPTSRLQDMAEDAQLALLVSHSSVADALPWPRAQSLWLDADAAQLAAQSDTPLAPDAALDAEPESPAYIIYTSGSTGKPKGVVLPHRAVVNFLLGVMQRPGMVSGERLLAVTTLSFDIAVLELMLPLASGACVVLATREQANDGQALRQLIEAERVTTLQATPSTWRLLFGAGWNGRRRVQGLGRRRSLTARPGSPVAGHLRRSLEYVRPDRNHRVVHLLARVFARSRHFHRHAVSQHPSVDHRCTGPSMPAGRSRRNPHRRCRGGAGLLATSGPDRRAFHP